MCNISNICINFASKIANTTIMRTKIDIRRAIKERGYSVKSFAEAHGLCAQNILQNMIKGNPTVKKLEEISEKLGCDVTDLFYPIEDNSGIAKAPTQTEESKESPTEMHEKVEPIQTTTYCPHCGAKVRVGVVLLAE